MFSDEKDEFIVIYLDDIMVYSASDKQHLKHLKKVFQKCRKFDISLNPKKSHFGVEEEKLLGHVISKEFIKIDPNRVEGIPKIITPCSKKGSAILPGKGKLLKEIHPKPGKNHKAHNLHCQEGKQDQVEPRGQEIF